jgi:hypothetical protein
MRVSKIGSFACLRVTGLCDGKAGKCANVDKHSFSSFLTITANAPHTAAVRVLQYFIFEIRSNVY